MRTHDFVRYASTLFMPAAQRRALLAIYAFNAEISRVREQVSQPLPGEMRLQWWTDMLAGAGHGGIEGNPVAAELLLVIRDYRLPVDPLSRLIDEHQFDLYNDPMPSMAALEGYINDTSSALFSLAARGVSAIGGDRSSGAPCRFRPGPGPGDREFAVGCRAASAVRAAAIAAAHGSGMEEVFLGKQTPQARAAIDHLVGQAREHLQDRLRTSCRRAGEVRPVFLPLALVRRDLERMSRADSDPFVPGRRRGCERSGLCGVRHVRGLSRLTSFGS